MTVLSERSEFLTLWATKWKRSISYCLSARLGSPCLSLCLRHSPHPWGTSRQCLRWRAKEKQLQTLVRRRKRASPALWEHEGLAPRRSSQEKAGWLRRSMCQLCLAGEDAVGEKAGALRDQGADSSAGGHRQGDGTQSVWGWVWRWQVYGKRIQRAVLRAFPRRLRVRLLGPGRRKTRWGYDHRCWEMTDS